MCQDIAFFLNMLIPASNQIQDGRLNSPAHSPNISGGVKHDNENEIHLGYFRKDREACKLKPHTPRILTPTSSSLNSILKHHESVRRRFEAKTLPLSSQP